MLTYKRGVIHFPIDSVILYQDNQQDAKFGTCFEITSKIEKLSQKDFKSKVFAIEKFTPSLKNPHIVGKVFYIPISTLSYEIITAETTHFKEAIKEYSTFILFSINEESYSLSIDKTTILNLRKHHLFIEQWIEKVNIGHKVDQIYTKSKHHIIMKNFENKKNQSKRLTNFLLANQTKYNLPYFIYLEEDKEDFLKKYPNKDWSRGIMIQKIDCQ